MAGCKNQLIMKYYCHIEFIIYIRKFTIVNIFGWDSLSRNTNSNQRI